MEPRRASSAAPIPPPPPAALQVVLLAPRQPGTDDTDQRLWQSSAKCPNQSPRRRASQPASPEAARSSPSVRTGSSQDASHKTGLPIEALDINRDRTHAILAGKEILKTVRVQQQDASIVEETNLRAAVIHYADHAHARQRDGLGIQDVKWSHGQFNTHIATAAANGKVILYDLNRAGVELARLHEHTRQVHRLAFNPHQGHLLLSASHDTTVRLWDLRDMRKDITTCRSRDQYAGINGGIYDVQWSPTDAVEFAFGTDNGTIQRWDFRHTKASKQKITAHDQKTCTAIDWHPDGKHLLSAGVDRTVKVWDFSVGVRRQKPVFVLTTPYPVYNARWRPPNWSEEGAYQCTQLATAYDRDHSVIHLWDFRRPFLPFREINKFPSAPSDMLWHSRDTLWTVGREGIFQQNDVHHAPRVLDRRNLQAIAVSPNGEIGGVAQRRPRRRRSTGLAYSEDTYGEPRDKRSSPEKSSLRSSADDSFDESFLLSRRHHGRTASNRSAKSFGSTPSSDTAPKVMFLTDSMAVQHEFSRPNQLAFRGLLPGAMNVQVFAYLAQKYKAIPLPDPPTLQSFEDLQQVFEQNAEYAQRAAFYRLATTWRLVGVSVANSTQRRAQLHRNRRRLKAKPTTLASSDVQPKPPSETLEAHDKQISQLDPAIRAPVDLIQKSSSASDSTAHPIATVESTSNLATPLARPLAGTPLNEKQRSHLPDPDRDEKIELPPAVAGPHSNHGLLAPGSASHSQNASRPSFKGPQWYHSSNDLDERRAMVGSWRAPPRVPLTFDPTESRGLNIQVPPRLDRHDSDESFAMFSASTDSQRGNSVPSSLNSGNSHSQSLDATLPGESSFGKPGPSIHGTADQPEALGRSVQISPTTILIGKDGDTTTTSSPNGVQLGSARDDADHPVETSSQEQAVQDIETLRRNNQLLRHDSSESDAFTSSGSGLSISSFMEYSHDMEASGTIVPEGYDDATSPQGLKPPATLAHATEGAPPVLDHAAEDPLLLADYQAMQVDADEGSSFAMIGLLQNLLTFFTDSQADAQTSSLLLLLLAPLLPQTRVDLGRPDLNLTAVSAAYTETFTALGLSPAQSETILSTELTRLVAAGINPYQAEAILQTYHSQLHSLSLYNAAATLRRLAYPTYPAVYEQALKGTQIGLLCLSCKSPINNPKDKMRCETCKRAQAPCPICWGRYPAFEATNAKKKAKAKYRMGLKDRDHKRKRSSLLSNLEIDEDEHDDEPAPSVPESVSPPKAMLWTWCPICGHGGHTHCLSTWFASATMSNGACATEGCLCDCVQGKRRDEKIQQILRVKAEKERAKIVRKGDDWKVSESRAVSAVRGAFDDSTPARDAAPNAGATASAQVPRTKEDGRRVRVVEPHADQHLPLPPPVQQGSTFGKMPK
ncbi:SEA (Seh1-associated) complex subunit [Kalmusia sp. IMI 367209]|nr:SEA (Seh1-associated) complex subunit [Kalmusia sp. IMI 367209]